MIDIRRSTTFFFLLVSLCHVLLISAQVQSKSGVPLLESLAFRLYSPVARASSSVVNGAGSLWHRYVAVRGVVSENEQLRAKIAQLDGQLQEQTARAAQAKSLESTLKLQQSVAQRTLAARVIAGDPTPGALTITIDRGTADGLRMDLGVIAAGGIVGRVMGQPLPHTARVQLLTGRGAAAGAVLERINAAGIVTGSGDKDMLRMQYVNLSFEVKVGDVVKTSGQDSVFPAGFAIGAVSQIERGSGTYKLIGVRPAVNFSHLDIVLVLLDPPPAPGAGGGL